MGRSPGMSIPVRVKSTTRKRSTNPMRSDSPLEYKIEYQRRPTNPM